MGIRLKDLSKLGYRDNVARSLVVDIVGKYCKHDTKEQIAMTLSNILEHPESYKNNEIWSKLAERLSPTVLAKEFVAYDLREDPLMYKTYGGKFIETLAKQQMNLAMRLPVTVGGALMPDAHAGYGLPIGGVLATDNAVIPYAVGVDIGCRMSLTVFDTKADFLKRYSYQIKEALKKMLSQADVTLIGGSIEEMPLAYKDIDRVMYTQETLVEVQGRFMPRIVRMNKE